MPEIVIRVVEKGARRLAGNFKRAAVIMPVRIRQALAEHGRFVVSTIRRENISGKPGLVPRTGTLSKSIKFRITSSDRRPALRIFSKASYARIHEEGGTITPKRASKLAVPLSVSLKDAYPEPVSAHGLVAISISGRSFLFDRALIRATHSLKNSVFIPPRLGLRKTMRASLPRLSQKLVKAIITVLRER